MTLRTLFTGSREWTDEAAIKVVVEALPQNTIVIHGGARGADEIVDRFARARGLPEPEVYPADWERYGMEAGSIRNQEMLDRGKPDNAFAFPLASSRGTWDMVKRLRAANVPVKVCGASTEVESAALALVAADERVAHMVAYDSETRLFHPGRMAPPIVCASAARFEGGEIKGRLLPDPTTALAFFRALLDAGHVIAFANAAYDLAVAASADTSLLRPIFRALREGRIYDLIIAEALNAIYHGHLGEMPNGQPLYNPATGEQTKRYSLALAVLLTLGRSDAKENDTWKKSYALLEGISVERWPEEARVYPVDDAVNTLETAATQIIGRPGEHFWETLPGTPIQRSCRWCRINPETADHTPPFCDAAPRRDGHKNLENLPAQCRADFAAKLGACWALRTDPDRVEALSVEVDKKHAAAVERFQKKGWIREDGTEDQSAVKRAVAVAYGAKDPCKRCGGSRECSKCGGSGKNKRGEQCGNCDGAGRLIGKMQKIEFAECRGVKERGRFQGCPGATCGICHGARSVPRAAGETTCKNEFDERGRLVEEGCDGTGFDLTTVPTLPRTDKHGVGTDRDVKMESGDDDLADYGEDEFEKSRSTNVPWLRTGLYGPLSYSPNVIVATGRYSLEGSPIHQLPRHGGERECIRARGAWCGSPIEYVFGATDYEAGELCTLSQLCYWLFEYSQMREAINASGKPGILHSVLAAEVLGISLEEFLPRLKAKDKQAVDFRQMCKPINFGKGGGMGDAKLVLTSRKKNAGFTVSEYGPAVNDKGQPGYWGVRFCLLTGGAKQCGIEKIMEYKRRPCAPVCKECVSVVANELNPAYFRRYPEMKDYFKWGSKQIDAAKRAGRDIVLAPTPVWDASKGETNVIRERGVTLNDYSALLNNGFQSMLAEAIKLAYWRMTYEGYTGVRWDNEEPSTLAGARFPIVMHDEPISELPRWNFQHSAPRIADIMMEAGREIAPDVAWRAETAVALYLSKSMEPKYENGELVLWESE
jgi:hypothetical protein